MPDICVAMFPINLTFHNSTLKYFYCFFQLFSVPKYFLSYYSIANMCGLWVGDLKTPVVGGA